MKKHIWGLLCALVAIPLEAVALDVPNCRIAWELVVPATAEVNTEVSVSFVFGVNLHFSVAECYEGTYTASLNGLLDFGDNTTQPLTLEITQPSNSTRIYEVAFTKTYDSPGTYTVAGTATYVSSRTPQPQTVNITGVMIEILQNSCPVQPPAEATGDAQGFEPPNTHPTRALFAPFVESSLDIAMSSAQSNPAGRSVTRAAGYRPYEYQQHLYGIRQSCVDYATAIHKDPALISSCAPTKLAIDLELAKHSPWGSLDKNGCPGVNNPALSLHSITSAAGGAQALDMNVAPSNYSLFVPVASAAGLYTPCASQKHFTRKGKPCDETVRGTGRSPIDLLLIDPLGRRVGFDRFAGGLINEIGETADYSGPESDPEYIDVQAPVPGQYTLISTGTGSGPFLLSLSRLDEDGEVVEQSELSGVTSVGEVATINVAVPTYVSVDIRPDSDDNRVNISAKGVIPVALLSGPGLPFPVDVDVSSLRFGHIGNEASARSCTTELDINLDTTPDLLCHFEMTQSQLAVSDVRAWITGFLTDGTPIRGNDWINVVSPQTKN